jgi:hypothetical protein
VPDGSDAGGTSAVTARGRTDGLGSATGYFNLGAFGVLSNTFGNASRLRLGSRWCLSRQFRTRIQVGDAPPSGRASAAGMFHHERHRPHGGDRLIMTATSVGNMRTVTPSPAQVLNRVIRHAHHQSYRAGSSRQQPANPVFAESNLVVLNVFARQGWQTS